METGTIQPTVAADVGVQVVDQTPDPWNDDRQQMLDFLGHLLVPVVGCQEIRILEADLSGPRIVPGEKYKKTVIGCFDDAGDVAREAKRPTGISAYIAPNPVNKSGRSHTGKSLAA